MDMTVGICQLQYIHVRSIYGITQGGWLQVIALRLQQNFALIMTWFISNVVLILREQLNCCSNILYRFKSRPLQKIHSHHQQDTALHHLLVNHLRFQNWTIWCSLFAAHKWLPLVKGAGLALSQEVGHHLSSCQSWCQNDTRSCYMVNDLQHTGTLPVTLSCCYWHKCIKTHSMTVTLWHC